MACHGCKSKSLGMHGMSWIQTKVSQQACHVMNGNQVMACHEWKPMMLQGDKANRMHKYACKMAKIKMIIFYRCWDWLGQFIHHNQLIKNGCECGVRCCPKAIASTNLVTCIITKKLSKRGAGRSILLVCGVPLTTHVFAAMEACTTHHGNKSVSKALPFPLGYGKSQSGSSC
jgi:hypothetical protein